MNIFQIIKGFDVTVYHFLGRFAGNWFFDRIVSHEESNSLVKGALFFAMYWYLWFRNDPDQKNRRRSIISVLIGTLVAIFVARTIAFAAPFRTRPMYDPTIAHSSFSIPLVGNLENWSSFPSDTAAYFFALAFGLGYLMRPLAVPMVLYAGVWVCLPRMYMGAHWTSDIVLGSIIGITATWLSLKSSWLQSIVTERIVPIIETRPEWFYSIAFLGSFEMAVIFENCRHLGRALLHVAAIESHVGIFQIRAHTPGDEWAGFVAIAILLGIATYMRFVLFHKRRGVAMAHPLVERMQTASDGKLANPSM